MIKYPSKWDCHTLQARALKDDVVILRKCSWGAMTVILGMLLYDTTDQKSDFALKTDRKQGLFFSWQNNLLWYK